MACYHNSDARKFEDEFFAVHKIEPKDLEVSPEEMPIFQSIDA